MLRERQRRKHSFRSLSEAMNYNLKMLNDPTQMANFERPNGAARVIAATPSRFEAIIGSKRPQQWPMTIALLGLILFAVGFALRPQHVSSDPAASNKLAGLEYPPIVVSVSGEVAQPGTYELPWGSRAKDAIRAAGGPTKSAEASLLNPAAQLEDGEQLLVPGKAATNTSSVTDAKLVSGERINLNTASQAQLEALPGVGPIFAARLIAGRPYSGFEDVDRVKGVGPKMLEKLKNLVRF
jgi:competence protein ComEA